MTIVHHEIPTHLNYFLCLEDDLQKLSRWIEFSKDNEKVYSIELARLLMTASAEVDVVAKALCQFIDSTRNARSINVYQSVLTEALPILPSAEVYLPRFGMTFHPWSNWRENNTPPDWWTGNNKVKHHRSEHFHHANLKNVLNAVAGLLVLVTLLYSRENSYLHPAPRLFEPRNFAIQEGHGLRLYIPDGCNVPWA